MIPPAVYFTEPDCSALVSFDADALGCSITSWPRECLVDVAWRLPAAARVGAIECSGVERWERKGIWMTAIISATQSRTTSVRVSRTADLDGDGFVDAADLSVLLGDWGGPEARSDLDIDGDVDAADQAVLLGAWGPAAGGVPTTRPP